MSDLVMAGPRGDKGDPGATGAKGDKGDAGATGSKGDPGGTVTAAANGTEVTPARGALDFVGGAPVEDDPTNKRTRILIVNEKVWLQHQGVVANGGTDQGPAIQAALNLAKTAIGGKNGSVSGEPGEYQVKSTTKEEYFSAESKWHEIDCGLHVPGNVSFSGPGGAGFQLRFSNLGVGKFWFGLHGAEFSAASYQLADMNLRSIAARPANFATSSTPPAVCDGIFAYRGGMKNIITADSNIRHTMAMMGDHFGVYDSKLGAGWAAVGFLTGARSEFNNTFIHCDFSSAAFCNWFAEEGRRIAGIYSEECHFGVCAGPSIYAKVMEAEQQFLESCYFAYCAWETVGRGIVVNDDMNGQIKDNTWFKSQNGAAGDGALGGYLAGDPTQLADALIKGGNIQGNKILGDGKDGGHLITCGYDPTNGCVIRGKNVYANDWGNITRAALIAELVGMPFMRVSGGQQADNTGEIYPGFNLPRRRVFFRTLDATAKRGDVLRKSSSVSSSLAGPFAHARAYDALGAVPAGVALRSGVSGDVIPVAVPNPSAPSVVPVNVARLGGAAAIGGANNAIPATAKTGSTELLEALQLGTGEALPRTTYRITLPQAIILINGLSDLKTGGGTVTIGTQVVTYKKAEVVEGVAKLLECSGGSGEVAANTPVSRAAQVASLTGFAAGVCKFGATFAVYRGTKEQGGKKYLTGISSNGGGEIASGSAAVNQTIFQVAGPTADYPEGPASAACASNGAQFAYEIFLRDKAVEITAASNRGFFAGITRTVGAAPANAFFVVGGTTLKTEVTLPAATIEVPSTAGFPSSGKCKIGTSEFSYTGITGTTFTGCSGGTGTFAAGQPITPLPGAQVEDEEPVRPRYSPATPAEGDKGLAAQSSGPGDSNGYLLGQSVDADEGGVVLVEV